jgi:arginine decarboxylase
MKMNDLAGALVQTQRPLNIHLISGTGEGSTPRAAFDAALTDAGVADCNRLRSSSLIPPNAKIVCARPPAAPHADGFLQTVVMSQMQQGRPGRYAHAGIAWVQRHDDGRGLFIDLHDDDRGRLEHDLHAAFAAIPCLRDAARGRVQTAFASRLCTGLPVCALVVAAFSGEARDLLGGS